MSRIGKKPVKVPQGVSVSVDGSAVRVKGPKGELAMELPAGIAAAVRDGAVDVSAPAGRPEMSKYHGLARSLLANMVEGVSKGYARELEVEGVGYRASVQGRKLVLSLGYSSDVQYTAPEGVKVEVAQSVIKVSGPDKQAVGDVAARIRAFHPPEPYKGKGIRYRGERVRRKAGKTVA